MHTPTSSSAVPQDIPPIHSPAPRAVLRWLRLGWHDVRHAGIPSLMHGLIVSVACLAMVTLSLLRWELLIVAASCFLIVGPFLATGLYALSRDLKVGARPTVGHAVDAWRQASHCLLRFGLLLAAVSALWVAFSLTLFQLFVDVRIAAPLDFLRYVLQQHDALFLLWSVSGGMVAAVMFGITAVSVPLLVDRDVTTWLAIRTSVRTVGRNPSTMLYWSMAILFLTALGFASLSLGFLILYPLLGHASWHAYRDLVDASRLPTAATPGQSHAIH